MNNLLTARLKITYSIFEAERTALPESGNKVEMNLISSEFETELAAFEYIANLDGYKEFIVVKVVNKNWV